METVEDLQLRSLQKVRTFSSQLSNKSRIQWLAVSSKFGLVIACCPTNQLIVYKCSDIHELNQTGTDQSETILQNQRKIDYYDSMCEIQFLKANFTGEILAIVVNKENEGSFVHLYDFRIFSIDRNDQPFPVVVLPLSKQINSVVTAFEWNPAEDVFAAACSDKSLLTVQFNILEHTKLTLLGIIESQEIVNCISWSPKGKQLTCGDAAGRIHQMKPDLTLVRTIDPPQEIPELGNGPFRCVGLCWLSTTEWLVAHALHNKEQFNISVLVTKKNQASSWSFLSDITYSNLSSPAISTANVQFYSIFDWSMVFLSSPNSSEISVVGNRSGSAWTHWVLEDTFSIQLPVSKSHGETYPIGVGFDFCSSTPVKIANDGSGDLPPQPIIYVLTTEGLLLLYHIVSLNPQRPTLN
uniref:Nucleoporin Nup159/Nup146 N-terminal domain-containing protein n=1 Tax=Acrobeloides nanus TaxID=290746 RepID=A0A914CL05_9BILA